MSTKIRYKESRFDSVNRKRIARGAEKILAVDAFKAAQIMFKEYLGWQGPTTYDEWQDCDEGDKAAILYVQFYEQITLAWYKTKSFYAVEEDGVSTVLQYLEKNVPVIERDPKRFTPSYIYRVAYNCLYCICHDIKVDRERYEKETSNIQSTSDSEEVDIFNLLASGFSIESELASERFWKAVESLGEDTLTWVDCTLNKTRFPAGLKAKSPKIIADLKVVLADFQDM